MAVVAVKLPAGQRVARRFSLAGGACALFDFVDAKWEGEGGAPYSLVAQ